MKIRTLILIILLFVFEVTKAQYTRLPVTGTPIYNIKDYGAVGDNKTLNTEAIQKALDQAKTTGGKVLVPPGEYLCGPLTIYSKTNLEIGKSATLRLRNDIAVFPNANGRYLNFIDVSNASDIKISGGGTIDGQGEVWWKATEDRSLKMRRPQMVYIQGAQRIEISDVAFLNPPNTHLSLKNSSDVYIHDITIKAPAGSHNTDGINISAKNCTIERCTINTGDDNIAINFGNRDQRDDDPEVQNMVIRHCAFGYGHGLSIGSFTSGNLRNLYVSDCSFDGTTSAIRIKTARGRGGILEHVRYENISIKNSHYPIFISEYYPREPKSPQEDVTTAVGDHNPVYKNISLKNITVTDSQEALIVWGIPESPIQQVSFDNVKISARFGAQIYNATQVTFINSSVNASGEKLRIYNSGVTGLN